LALLMPCVGAVAAEGSDAATPDDGTWLIPFAFYTESFDYAAGLGVVRTADGPKADFCGAMLSTNGTAVGFAGFSEWMPEERSRFSASGFVVGGVYPDQSVYTSPGVVPRSQRSGTNESDIGNRQRGSGYDVYGQVVGTYVLPVFDGSSGVGDRRLPPQERDPQWLPMGRGFLDAEWIVFHHSQEVNDGGTISDFTATGGGGALVLDCTDYLKNPTQGSRWRVGCIGDPGASGSDSWLLVEGQASVFIPLPAPGFTGRTVLALDAWTADTPTWREYADGTVRHRPPPSESASLGGFYRLRALPVARYNDRAAIHYTAELRLMPTWSPEFDLPLIGPLGINWWQAVAFAEFGRVAGDWELAELHQAMQYDVGFGLRAMVEQALVRADVAFSDETWGFKMMVGHTF
jgi:hypothetical protein